MCRYFGGDEYINIGRDDLILFNSFVVNHKFVVFCKLKKRGLRFIYDVDEHSIMERQTSSPAVVAFFL